MGGSVMLTGQVNGSLEEKIPPEDPEKKSQLAIFCLLCSVRRVTGHPTKTRTRAKTKTKS